MASDHDFTQYLNFGDEAVDNRASLEKLGNEEVWLPKTTNFNDIEKQWTGPLNTSGEQEAMAEMPQVSGRYSIPGEDLGTPSIDLSSMDNNQTPDYLAEQAKKSSNKNIAISNLLGSVNKNREPVSIPSEVAEVSSLKSDPLETRQSELDAALKDRQQNMRNSVFRGASTDFLNANQISRGRDQLKPGYGDQRLNEMNDLQLKDLNEKFGLAGKVSSEEKSKSDIQAEQALSDPNSPEVMALRKGMKEFFGDQLDPAVVDKLNGHQLKRYNDTLGGLFDKRENRDERSREFDLRSKDQALRASELRQRQDEVKQSRMDTDDTKRFDTVNKLITSQVQSSRTPLGKAAGTVQSVQNVEALLAGESNLDNIDSRQLAETVRVLDRVLSQGSPTVSGTEHLTPETLRMKAGNLLEKYTNKRQGAGAGDFLRNIQHTFQREKETSQKQIVDAQRGLLATYKDLAKNHKEVWDSMLIEHGLDPADFITNPSLDKKEEKMTGIDTNESVRMRDPDGQIKLVPKDKVDAAIKAHGKVI